MLPALLLTSCSFIAPPPACETPEQVLASVQGDQLTCGDVKVVQTFGELLAGRRMGSATRKQVFAEWGRQFRADPAAARATIGGVEVEVQLLSSAVGLEAAKARSRASWMTFNEQGPLKAERWQETRRLLRGSVLPWASSNEDRLLLVEEDIEGVVRFASLCREVQGAGPLQLSIANREIIYKDVIDRFNEGPTDDRVGLVAYGAFWLGIADSWKSASYEHQQAWIQRSTLPPPMMASSLGYAEAVLELPPARNAKVLHDTLGPFQLDERAK